MHRSTTIPIASGEHFYGRWEVERYLQAGGLSVVQADPEWCGGTSELLRIGTVASLHDVPVIPHGHSLRAAIHIIASQSPMTFPLGENLILKMRHYHHFESNPLVPDISNNAPPTNTGTRVPSLRIYSFSYGVFVRFRLSSSCACASSARYSGGVRARQLSFPDVRSSRV